MNILKNSEIEYKKFFKGLNVNKYKNIIFVSEKSKKEFETIMNLQNTVLCNNIIDYKKIEELAEEKIEEQKQNIFTFLYVGRITEASKKFSRILEAMNIIKTNNPKLKFKVMAVGKGDALASAQAYVKNNELENYIEFVGEKLNPYPYFKISDCLLLVSENEGYPVVYNEAKVLKLPILTTNVSDSEKDIKNKYGIVCKQDVKDIAKKMEYIITNGFIFQDDESIENNKKDINEKIKLQTFDAEKYNKKIQKCIENIINERN